MKSFSGKIDIGGCSLFVNIIDNRTNPKADDLTILFESGYGDGADSWTEIQNILSRHYATISYDRAGVENSDKSSRRRTVENQIEELHELLLKSGAKAPYLIVAHSIGGLNARAFAHKYPTEVKGIVFIDSTHEDVIEKVLPTMSPERQEMFLNRPVYEGDLSERLESCVYIRRIKNSDILRDMPIAVLTVESHELGTEWVELQNDLVKLSNNSTHLIISDCGHYIHEDKPEIVKQAIFNVADSIINFLR